MSAPDSFSANPNPPERIVSDPDILGGRPHIRGTRLSVEFLKGLLAVGWSAERILEVYQYLSAEDLRAAGLMPPIPAEKGGPGAPPGAEGAGDRVLARAA